MRKNKKKSVRKREVLDYITERTTPVTTGELAQKFEVCKSTMRRILSSLKREGHKILATREGQKLMNEVNNEHDANLVFDFGNWLASLIKMIEEHGQNFEEPAKLAAKFVRLAGPERKQFMKTLMLVKNVSETIELQAELDQA